MAEIIIPSLGPGDIITFTHANDRLLPTKRRVRIVKFGWGMSPWHETPQWLMLVIDLDEKLPRKYPMCDVSEIVKEEDTTVFCDPPAKAMTVLKQATGFHDASVAAAMTVIRNAGYVLVPVREIPTEAVGEVMACTGCESPELAWEALNCSLNMLGIEWPDDPTAMEMIRKLGAGEITLAEFREYKATLYRFTVSNPES